MKRSHHERLASMKAEIVAQDEAIATITRATQGLGGLELTVPPELMERLETTPELRPTLPIFTQFTRA